MHVGTLGGAWLKYSLLITFGILAFIFGTILEGKASFKDSWLYILITVIISIGTGMVSGATQHFLDGPLYAAALLPVGLVIGYIAFAFRDHKEALRTKNIVLAILLGIILWLLLYAIAHSIVPTSEHGHSLREMYSRLG